MITTWTEMSATSEQVFPRKTAERDIGETSTLSNVPLSMSLTRPIPDVAAATSAIWITIAGSRKLTEAISGGEIASVAIPPNTSVNSTRKTIGLSNDTTRTNGLRTVFRFQRLKLTQTSSAKGLPEDRDASTLIGSPPRGVARP